MKEWLLVCSLFLFFVLPLNAQPNTVNDEQNKTDLEIRRLNEVLKGLKNATTEQQKAIFILEKNLAKTQNKLSQTETELQKNIAEIGKSSKDAQTRVSGLSEDLSQRTVQFSIGSILIALLSLTGLIGAIVLRKHFAQNSASLEKDLIQMRDKLDKDTMKVDEKLIELLSNQMRLLQADQLVKAKGPERDSEQKEVTLDHSLPIKVGEEIFRMRLRLNALPAETKGLKPLLKSLERLEDEFMQKGYELVEMLGKKYDDGMNVRASFIPSDVLGSDERIISKVIKPQINYQGMSIQVAEIEVSTGG